MLHFCRCCEQIRLCTTLYHKMLFKRKERYSLNTLPESLSDFEVDLSKYKKKSVYNVFKIFCAIMILKCTDVTWFKFRSQSSIRSTLAKDVSMSVDHMPVLTGCSKLSSKQISRRAP